MFVEMSEMAQTAPVAGMTAPPAAPARADWAYTAGIVASLVGAALVFFLFPSMEAEQRLLASYHAEDMSGVIHAPPADVAGPKE